MTKDHEDLALGRLYRPAPKDRFKNLIVDPPEPEQVDWNFEDEPLAHPLDKGGPKGAEGEAAEPGNDEANKASEPAIVSAAVETGDGTSNPTNASEAGVETGAESRTATEDNSNWRDQMPKAVVKVLGKAAIDPKHPDRGGVDLESVVVDGSNDGILKSRRVSELMPAENRPGILGDFLSPDVTVLLGGPSSKAGALALAIAESVARGESVLGVRTEAAPVLYVDPVRPLAAIAAALTADRAQLENLMILTADDGDMTDLMIKEESKNLTAAGSPPRLVIINEIGRFTAKESAKKFSVPGGRTSVLLVSAEPKFRTHPTWKKIEKSKAVDLMASEKVLVLQPHNEDAVRLGVFEYGEMVFEVAVEPKDKWRSLGKPEEQTRSSRQDKVLTALQAATTDGLSASELAAIAEIKGNNVYQAVFKLKKEGKVVAGDRRYYASAFPPPPKPESSKK